MLLVVAIVAVALVAAVAIASSYLLWKKVKAAHVRIHRLERAGASQEKQFAEIARAALRAEAKARLGCDVSGHSQHGEDFFIWQRLEFKPEGTYIEIGAYDGVSLSNSLFFEQIGWKGMLVEAHPDLVDACRKSRPDASVVHAALGEKDGGKVTFSMVRGSVGLDTLSFVSTNDRHRRRIEANHGRIEIVDVPARNLESLLAESGIREVDWISVDVEGAELDVLKGAGLNRFRPKIILVEDNSGGVDTSVTDYLDQFGYQLEQTIGCNDLYVRHP